MRELSSHGDGAAAGPAGRDAAELEELPKSPGHVFYDRLQEVLLENGFDGFVEGLGKPYYAPLRARDRCRRAGTSACIWSGTSRVSTASAGSNGAAPTACRRGIPAAWGGRLPLEVHDAVFAWVLGRLAERNLVKGERIGIDASTMEANAAMRSIQRRDSGESYRAMLTRMAEASGIPTPTARPKEVQRWRGDRDARRAVYRNRARLRSGIGKEGFALRAEKVERYPIQVAAYNLGLGMRALLGAGTPQAAAARAGGPPMVGCFHRLARHPHHRAAKHPTRPDSSTAC